LQSNPAVKDSGCQIYKMAAESGKLKGRGVMVGMRIKCLHLDKAGGGWKSRVSW